jgi:CRP-like cAMP-binding protein
MAARDPAPTVDLVRRIPYFAGLDEAALADVVSKLRRRTATSGEQILTEGDACHGLYLVLAGQVRLVRTSEDGREVVLRVLGPGASFNDAAVFDGGLNSDSAVAVGPTVCGVLPKADMTALVERHPQMARAALKLLSGRQRVLGNIVEDLAVRDVTTRVARLLLGCLGHHDHIVDHAHEACDRITHQEIAAMVGSVREVVQRSLKELERDGAITLERSRVRVRDTSRLERWANPEA